MLRKLYHQIRKSTTSSQKIMRAENILVSADRRITAKAVRVLSAGTFKGRRQTIGGQVCYGGKSI